MAIEGMAVRLNVSLPSQWAFVGALCLIGVRATAGQLASRPLPGATRISAIADLDDYYYWLPNGDALLIRAARKKQSVVSTAISLLDHVTHHEVGLSKLTKLYNDTDGWLSESFAGGLSPDGKWLLWRGPNKGSRNKPHNAYTATLDGRQFAGAEIGVSMDIDAPMPHPVSWIGTGHEWIELLGERTGVHVAGSVRTTRTLHLPITRRHLGLYGAGFLGGRLFLAPSSNTRLDVVEYRVGSEATSGVRHRWEYESSFVWTSAVASSCDRVAWVVDYPSGKRAGRATAPGRESTALWIARFGGARVYEVGQLPRGHKSVARQLRWTPDGKAVSFIWHGALWRVPVRFGPPLRAVPSGEVWKRRSGK